MTSQRPDSFRIKHVSKEGLVSIVIATYNRPSSLSETLDSVFQQTYTNFEVIIVDDGSDSDLVQATRRYPVGLVRQVHSGAGAAWNNGFSHARGGYLLFMADDVQLRPHYLERMVKTLTAQRSAAFAYCDYEFDGIARRSGPFSAKVLRRSNYISGIALLRRDGFPQFDAKVRRLLDWDLWLTIAERGGRGVWIPEVLFATTGRNTPRITDDSSLHGLTYGDAYEIVASKHALLGFRYRSMRALANWMGRHIPEHLWGGTVRRVLPATLMAAGREGLAGLIRQAVARLRSEIV